MLSRAGGNIELAKLLAVLIFTVRGLPVTYYGEEIAMMEGEIPIKTCLDPVGRRYKNVPKIILDALDIYVNRDGCRTPMQWNSGKNAGFSETDGDLWLPLSANYQKQNVDDLECYPDSILNLYKELLTVRKNSQALLVGSLKIIDSPPDTLVYCREIPGELIGIFMNFSTREREIEWDKSLEKILFSTGAVDIRDDRICLPAYGAAVIRSR